MAKKDYMGLLEAATINIIESEDIEKVEAPEEMDAGEAKETQVDAPEQKEGEQALTEEESKELDDALEQTAPAKQEETLYEAACEYGNAKLIKLIESDGMDEEDEEDETSEELSGDEAEVGIDESMIIREADEGKSWTEKGKEYWEKLKKFFKNLWEKVKAFFKRIMEHAINLYYKLIGAYKKAVDTKNTAAGNKGWDDLKSDTSVVKNLYDFKKDALKRILTSGPATIEAKLKEPTYDISKFKPETMTEEQYEELKRDHDSADYNGDFLAEFGKDYNLTLDASAPVRQSVYYGLRGETVDSLGSLTYIKSFSDAVAVITEYTSKAATDATKKLNNEIRKMEFISALTLTKLSVLAGLKGGGKINRVKMINALQIKDTIARKFMGLQLSANLGTLDACRTILIQTTSIARACIKKGA